VGPFGILPIGQDLGGGSHGKRDSSSGIKGLVRKSLKALTQIVVNDGPTAEKFRAARIATPSDAGRASIAPIWNTGISEIPV
jgi:hypothetical protein